MGDARFDRIVFNFPHVGLGIKDQAHNVTANQRLLLGFFRGAGGLLRPGGEIHVAMKRGMPYELWEPVKMATADRKLRFKTALEFHPENFPGYAHRRTLGFKEGSSKPANEELAKGARTYVFVH